MDDVATLRFRSAAERGETHDREQRTRTAQRRIGFAVTLLLHVGLWQLLTSDPRAPTREGAPALQVVWVQVAPTAALMPIPPMPVAPGRHSPSPTSSRSPSRASTAVLRPVENAEQAAPTAAPAASIFDVDGRPRLPGTAPDDRRSRHPAQPQGDIRQLGSAPVRLPGSAEKIVDIGDMRTAMTPQMAVLGLAQFLFGAPQPDSCDKVERRLINETNPVVRDIDLHKYRKFCAGWR